MPSDVSGITFRNAVENTKTMNIFSYRNFYNGGGVAIGDINNDKLPDIYFTNNTGPNALYLNEGNFHFKDITATAGVGGKNLWSTGVVMVDVNGDGWLDVYVCNAGYRPGDNQQNELYVNNGDLTFTERAAEYGLDDNGYTTHAAFFDYDGDGDLDCYIVNNSFIPVNTLNYSGKRDLPAKDWPVKDFLKGGGDKLLRNDNGHYTDVTAAAGIYSSLIGFGLGVTVGDVNNDDLPDLYISNDFYERDYLYINNGDGTFSEQIEKWMQHISLSSMGADMADVNNDGYPDIYVTDMLPDDEYRLKTNSSFETYSVYQMKQQRDFYHQYMQNTLQLNNRNGTFSEIAYYSGVAASDWSWGALLFDMDNDGYRDIYICNGIYKDVTDQDFIDFFANDIIQRMVLTGKKEALDSVLKRMPSHPLINKAFRNMGDLKFTDESKQWGFDEPSFSNGAAYGDLDQDGDLDLVVNNLNQESFVYENTSEHSGNHYLRVVLVGVKPNTYAVGAKVSAYAGSEIHFDEVIPSRGFQSSVDYPVHFGLGGTDHVDSLVILWPDHASTTLRQPPVDTVLTIRYADVAKRHMVSAHAGNNRPFFTHVDEDFDTLAEDDIVDFYREGQLMKKLSQEGPAVSIGDLDNDGDQDVFIGGAAGEPARIYLQQDGRFIKKDITGIEHEEEFEDVCSVLFDADGDGDLDIFIGSGGNIGEVASRILQDRVYLNDGTGTFRLSPLALPNNGFNTGAVKAFDYDGDGDLDLIVGSRSVPLNYGVSPPTYLYQNDGTGKFADVTNEIAHDMRVMGMITDIALADLDGDGKDEVIFTGEWMAPVAFKYHGGKFTRLDIGLDADRGWWNRVAVADVDNDGDQDLVLGNRGENFYFSGSEKAPVKLWLADFDNNGNTEKIVTRTVNGRDMPVSVKRDLADEIESLGKPESDKCPICHQINTATLLP